MDNNNNNNEANNNVYVSFDGKDSSVNSFISYLIAAFKRQGISAFLGGKISHDEVAAIKREPERFSKFRIFVVIFSKNYAFYCDNDDFLVVPVFYDVSRSSVKQHMENLGDAYEALQRSETTCPQVHEYHGERSEYEFVEEIARDVFEKLYPTEEIGIYGRQLEIEKLLRKQRWGLRTIGIYGEHGIGKTTLVRAVFRRMSGDFDASCFIEDFHSKKIDMRLQPLPLEYLSTETPMQKFYQGSSDLEPSYRKKRVLVALDDVRKDQDAKSFLGGFDKFGSGSLIIITSKEREILELCQMNEIYELKGLNDEDALKLFKRYAYGKDDIEENLLDLPMIKQSQGKPSVLRSYAEKLKGQEMVDMGQSGNIEKKAYTNIPNKVNYEPQEIKELPSDRAILHTKTMFLPLSELHELRSYFQKHPKIRIYRLEYRSWNIWYQHIKRLWRRYSKSHDINQLEHNLQVLLDRSGGCIMIKRLLQGLHKYTETNSEGTNGIREIKSATSELHSED